MRSLPSRLRALWRAVVDRRRLEAEMAEEFRLHVELRAEDLVRSGLAPAEAARRARLEFGGEERFKEEGREAWGGRWLDDALHDARLAVRQVRREPGFAVLAVLTLALGIAANATMFGVVDRLLLRPPAGIADPGRVVRLYFRERMSFGGRTRTFTESGTSWPGLQVLRRDVPAFAAVTGSSLVESTLGEGPAARRVQVALVAPDYFATLGTRRAVGRLLGSSDRDEPVGVLSYPLWQKAFGGDPAVIGRAVLVEGRLVTVVGVAAPGFRGLDSEPADLWVPARFLAPVLGGPSWEKHRSYGNAVARLRPGARAALAGAQATAAYRHFIRAGASAPGRDTMAQVLPGSIIAARGPFGLPRSARISLWLAGVAAIVLLVACANIAGLLLARALRRRREIAMRLALGAGRGRIVRQLLTETLLLATMSGALAVLLTFLGGHSVRALLIPGSEPAATVNGRVLAVTAAATLLATLLAGLAPALRAGRTDVAEALKGGAREGGPRHSRLQSGLLVAQAALSTALLVGAGLFVLSLHRVRSRDVGIDIDRVLLIQMPLRLPGRLPPAVVAARYEAAYARARLVPGVNHATLEAGSAPGSRLISMARVKLPGEPTAEGPPAGLPPMLSLIDADYFATIGARVVRGRAFSEADGHPGSHVVVVNRMLAEREWPGANPLGKCLIVGTDPDCREVVGVVEDVTAGTLTGNAAPILYLPRELKTGTGLAPTALLVRVRDGARIDAVAAALHRDLQSLAPDMPYVQVRSYADVFAPELAPWRLGATMFSLFGALALVMAAVGLFSVLAYTVAQRTHEIGVRIALGGPRGLVMRLVVLEGVRLVALGLAAGLAAALAAGRFLKPLLYHTSPRDPHVLAGVVATLLIAAVAAAVIPGLRAAGVDPMDALRAE